MPLSVAEFGSGSVPLVLVHGWGFNRSAWAPLVACLGADFRIFCPDLPGHGDSPPWSAATDLAAVAAAISRQVPAPALWLGWSLGGLVALAAATRDPHSVAGLCLVATNPRFVATPDWPTGVAPAVFREFARLLEAKPLLARRRFAALVAEDEAERRAATAALAAEPAWAGDPGRLKRPLSMLEQGDLRAGLGRLHCPVSWLLARGDRLVPPALAERVEESHPGWRVGRHQGGHAFVLSHPGPVAVELQRLAGHVH